MQKFDNDQRRRFRRLQLRLALRREKMFSKFGVFGYQIAIHLRDAYDDERKRGMNISSISNVLGISRRTLKRHLDKMEQLDWIEIERRKNESLIKLTPKAIEVLDPWGHENLAMTWSALQLLGEPNG